MNTMDNFFYYVHVEDGEKVKYVISGMNGHAALWWDEVQSNSKRKGKEKIKIWDRMVAKLKTSSCLMITNRFFSDN